MPETRHLTIPPEHAGRRLDQSLAELLPEYSRSRLAAWADEGRVHVDGGGANRKQKVWGGERVTVEPEPLPEETSHLAEDIELDVVYEDDDILAVNKQAGLVVHPVSLHRHDTLLNALYWRYKDVLPPEQEVSLANRLDANTSGLVLVTKHTRAKQILQEQFEARVPQKTYLALCAGVVQPEAGEIDRPIGPALGRKDRCKRCGVCASHCPVGACTFEKDSVPVIEKSKCIKCYCCQEFCPHDAIALNGTMFRLAGMMAGVKRGH